MLKQLSVLIIFLVFCVLWTGADGYPLQAAAKMVVSEIRTYNWSSKKGWFEGQVSKIMVEKYDEKGRVVSEELYYGDMVLMEKTVCFYEDNLVKKTTTDHENKLVRSSVVRREEDTITETVLRADGSLFYKTVSLLRNNGQVKELEYYNGQNEKIFVKVFEYSDAGDLTSIRIYNPDGSFAVLISITYHSFDDKGNWLARSEYYTYADVYGRPRDHVSRNIKYYNDDIKTGDNNGEENEE